MISGHTIELLINGKKVTKEEYEKYRLDWMEAEDLRLSKIREEEEREANRIFTEPSEMETVVYAEGGPPFSPDELEELVKSLTRDVARLFLKLQER